MISLSALLRFKPGDKFCYNLDTEEAGLIADVELAEEVDLEGDDLVVSVRIVAIHAQWGNSYKTTGSVIDAHMSELDLAETSRNKIP